MSYTKSIYTVHARSPTLVPTRPTLSAHPLRACTPFCCPCPLPATALSHPCLFHLHAAPPYVFCPALHGTLFVACVVMAGVDVARVLKHRVVAAGVATAHVSRHGFCSGGCGDDGCCGGGCRGVGVAATGESTWGGVVAAGMSRCGCCGCRHVKVQLLWALMRGVLWRRTC